MCLRQIYVDPCATTLTCATLPLVNKPRTFITCTDEGRCCREDCSNETSREDYVGTVLFLSMSSSLFLLAGTSFVD
ncbi:hypothetical protein L218DRAFT_752342 [Marasmius fiardii PR-910]|nr:hypothetical protein L218DRAFT_752342 [Marasmius fiardii PR-910]